MKKKLLVLLCINMFVICGLFLLAIGMGNYYNTQHNKELTTFEEAFNITCESELVSVEKEVGCINDNLDKKINEYNEVFSIFDDSGNNYWSKPSWEQWEYYDVLRKGITLNYETIKELNSSLEYENFLESFQKELKKDYNDKYKEVDEKIKEDEKKLDDNSKIAEIKSNFLNLKTPKTIEEIKVSYKTLNEMIDEVEAEELRIENVEKNKVVKELRCSDKTYTTSELEGMKAGMIEEMTGGENYEIGYVEGEEGLCVQTEEKNITLPIEGRIVTEYEKPFGLISFEDTGSGKLEMVYEYDSREVMHEYYLGKIVFDMDGNIYEDNKTNKYQTTHGWGAHYCNYVERSDNYYVYQMSNSLPDSDNNEDMYAIADLDVYDSDLNLIYSEDNVDYDTDLNYIEDEATDDGIIT